MLHPLDWERFYDFVKASHMLQTKLPATDLRELLNREGFSGRQTDQLVDMYDHGRELLKRGNPFWGLRPRI